ncbi:hypothetical protein HRbin22_01023 [Candidatus Thermoflexus japonica]|uniref:Low molecular weight protein antigen 6 PH domain-containing protein n=1 Tax=Candidatus Thermoflexus japonica TaxID=2035417 RepID=A0A2H5Y5V7_9CHLR|nr:hypothetical protein HRbin22_01023 [Candidatus Thermoflexus japonica]
MGSNDGWRAVQWGIWWILMLLVMRWISRSRLRTPATAGARRLVYPRSIGIIGLAGAIFSSAIAMLSSLSSTASPVISLLFLAFALLSIWIVAEYARVQHEITETGITYRRLIARGGHLPWSEIRRVYYSSWRGAFVLQGSSGERLSISTLMAGLPEFAQMLLRKAPPEAIDARARILLQETAAGRPPGLPF